MISPILVTPGITITDVLSTPESSRNKTGESSREKKKTLINRMPAEERTTPNFKSTQPTID